MPEPLVRALLAHLDSVFAGPNGDYPAVMEALGEVTAEQAAWKPGAERNSIWQIVDHLAESKRWALDMLATGSASPPVWTEPDGDPESWARSVAALKAIHTQLQAAIAQVSDEALLAPGAEGEKTLLEYILSSGAAHDAYHSGQIDYLRGLQGA